MTANEFVNVKDIKGGFLYTRDQYVFGFLRIHYFNLDLLSQEERRSKTNALSASFGGSRKPFVYMSFPREIDIDLYKNDLKRRYSEEMFDLGRKHILQELIYEAIELATCGENYEHQHFIKIWEKAGVQNREAENVLRERLETMKVAYEGIGVSVDILSREPEIIKLCNLFGNAIQAPYDQVGQNSRYEMLTVIR